MRLRSRPGRRYLVMAAAMVLLGCLSLLLSGCVENPHAFLWDGRTVTELPNTLGGTTSEANDINAWDWAVGWAADETGTQRAVIWKRDRMYRLPSLRGGESVALAINDLGQAVGWERDPFGYTHAVLWSLGRARDLSRSHWTSSTAYDINNSGQVVGSFERDGTTHPFSWRSGRVTEFKVAGEAYAVNLPGAIGGRVTSETGYDDPWLYSWGHTTFLPKGDTSGEVYSAVEGLNDRCVAAGWVVGSTPYLPVRWSSGALAFLALPDGMDSGLAYDISLLGEVVGEVRVEDFLTYRSYAAIWSGGEVRLIPSLGDGSLDNYANAVNIRGHVVGASEKDGGSNTQLGREQTAGALGSEPNEPGGRATVLLFDAGGVLIAELNDQTKPVVRSAGELISALTQPAYADTARVILRLEWQAGGEIQTSDWTFFWQDGALKTPDGDLVLPR